MTFEGEIIQSVSEIATIITAIIVCLTTLLLSFKSFRVWIATLLANSLKFDKLSKDSDLIKELDKNATYESNFRELELSILRMEILRYLDFHPDDKRIIYELIDKYEKLGGNSYMCSLIKNWEDGNHVSTINKLNKIMEEYVKNTKK